MELVMYTARIDVNSFLYHFQPTGHNLQTLRILLRGSKMLAANTKDNSAVVSQGVLCESVRVCLCKGAYLILPKHTSDDHQGM